MLILQTLLGTKNKKKSFFLIPEQTWQPRKLSYTRSIIQRCSETFLLPENVHIPRNDSQNTRRQSSFSTLDKVPIFIYLFLLVTVHGSLVSLLPFILPSAYSCCQTPSLPLPSPLWRAMGRTPPRVSFLADTAHHRQVWDSPSLTIHRTLRGSPGTVQVFTEISSFDWSLRVHPCRFPCKAGSGIDSRAEFSQNTFSKAQVLKTAPSTL